VLRPWFLAHDAFPHSDRSLGAIFDSDLHLNVWILAWTAHALLTEPAKLFDGNIYYPAPNTIAGSENMLAHLPVTVPALAATDNALVVMKAMALESFVLAGLAMFALVLHHTEPGRCTRRGSCIHLRAVASRHDASAAVSRDGVPALALLAVDCWLERRARARSPDCRQRWRSRVSRASTSGTSRSSRCRSTPPPGSRSTSERRDAGRSQA
jgi:hypothetical protein